MPSLPQMRFGTMERVTGDSLDEEEKYALGVLLLDECECAVGVDRVPPGASISSSKAVTCRLRAGVIPLRRTR
jgi:hypothetical protein